MTVTAILGAGIAGLGAAYRLAIEGERAVVYEKEQHYGGNCGSYTRGGFTFDKGCHVSFTESNRVKDLFSQSVSGNYNTVRPYVDNYWKGYWIKHPVQCNLSGLPANTVADVLLDLVEARYNGTTHVDNYKDWLFQSFGAEFSKLFPMQYGLKYHTTEAENMSTDWIGSRVYRPDLKEVFTGALSTDTKDVHYVSEFRYPSKGGFSSYLHQLASSASIQVGHELSRIDWNTHELYFSSGERVSYDFVISSIPLPELIPMIDNVPDSVREAARKLACTTCVVVDIGLKRSDISSAHWTYFYDREIPFARISSPHMQSPSNAPPGGGSIQAEIYYSDKYHPLDRKPQDFVQPVLSRLERCGLIREDDEILFTNAGKIPYANVIFDHDRKASLAQVLGFLNDIEVHSCGRYGEWGYHWTDESFLSGEQAAQKVLNRVGRGDFANRK